MNSSNESGNSYYASWDHPWTTDEMRQHKCDWSLAGDVGLLKHLQRFSENLTARVQDTQSTLNELNSQLNETTVLIDNITNVSLSLANTQFIESRVHEDDADRAQLDQKPHEPMERESKDLNEAEMMTAVIESIQQGLAIMEEKYERLEVEASDSEDESEAAAPSFLLRPKDPYQNRPLPFVIESNKWRESNKIGLESSSESEGEEEDTEPDDKETSREHILHSNINRQKIPITRSLSSSSDDSSDFNDKSNTTKHLSGLSSHIDKLHTPSQDTLNSASEITTPITGGLSRGDQTIKDSFAEELTKRLGSVLPPPKSSHDAASINRSKDDLFTADDKNDDEDIFSTKSENLFTNDGGLFDNVPNSLWKDEPFKKPKTHIIPASLDVPPPISSIDQKPKSSIDDLFGDGDSEDSDDIFSPKSSAKNTSKSTIDAANEKAKNQIISSNRLGIDNASSEKMATSTPDTNNSVPNLFQDDDDDGSLFHNPSVRTKSPEPVRATSKVRPPGVLVSQADLLSSTLGSRLFQQIQQESEDDSSDNECQQDSRENNSTAASNASEIVGSIRSSEISGSSGISVQPRSMNSTLGLSVGNWAPESESTRLPSEDLYRERVTSDSLLDPKAVQRENNYTVYSEANSSANLLNARIQPSPSIHKTSEEDIFDNDDVFKPPPLPKSNSKSKSKVISLFDDSDSGDDLFSNTSSGSRSQKSADILANPPQLFDKPKSSHNKGLFDEDIVASRDIPDIDIFSQGVPVKANLPSTKPLAELKADPSPAQVPNRASKAVESSSSLQNPTVKSTSIFDDSEDEDDDLFGAKIPKPNMFDDDTSNLFANSLGRGDAVPKKDSTPPLVGEKESAVKSEQKLNSDQAVDKLLSRIAPEIKLFDDSDGDDDLFSQKTPQSQDSAPLAAELSQTKQSEGAEAMDIGSTSNASSKGASIEDKESESETDGPKISKMKNPEDCLETSARRQPPKSLKIRLPIVGTTDEVNAAPRRAVSNKIKGLMSKMSDLKILSPTDTPLVWRKSGDKQDSEEDITPDRDSEDGSCISIPSTKSSPIKQKENPLMQEVPLSPSIEIETAVSFDVPAQAETLATASKSRARIPVKRRPQSRYARQTALRASGLDFDTVDSTSLIVDSHETAQDSSCKRLTAPHDIDDEKTLKPTLNLLADDKSEMSLGKESSISITKNTLLSPSTDEEDIFDVPPDLPEDPQKEDSLFGRAPILSPVLTTDEDLPNQCASSPVTDSLTAKEQQVKEENNSIERKIDNEPIDPLHDDSHDSLKDPSQLFAFVTKTPSPEKGQNLFNEDDSLFSHNISKQSAGDSDSGKKSSLDIFTDDTNNDLFSASFVKSIKSAKATRNNLFSDVDSDEDATDDLFGSASSKRSTQSKSEQSDIDINDVRTSPKQNDVFDDDDDEDLFFDASERPSSEVGKYDSSWSATNKTAKVSKLEDIFGDQSGGEDDIFSVKKTTSKATPGLFFSQDEDENTNDIFGKQPSTSASSGPVKPVKKSVARDLRKTAEQIVEDPLSMLHDD